MPNEHFPCGNGTVPRAGATNANKVDKVPVPAHFDQGREKINNEISENAQNEINRVM